MGVNTYNMLNNDIYCIFEKYIQLCEQQSLGNLIGAQSGGEGGNWGGSLPKLISILPMGNWKSSSQKRSKIETASKNISDHFEGNKFAYAADFGLNTTFASNVQSATNFAINVARNAGRNVSSWEPFINSVCDINTPDGYRVQIIWQSNVGGDHYNHVHVGVKRTGNVQQNNTEQKQETPENKENNTRNSNQNQQTNQENPYESGTKSFIQDIYNTTQNGKITPQIAQKAFDAAKDISKSFLSNYGSKYV